METYNRISLTQIDIDAAADYIVAKKKLVYRTGDETVAADSKAQDTENVGGIPSDRIAVAISDEDRSTVDNALKLGGVPSTEYMTVTQGGSLSVKQERLSENYGTELRNLMDELYSLRQELSKKGIIEDRGEYVGYTDIFRTNSVKHMDTVIAEAVPVETSNRDGLFIEDSVAFSSLNQYDFVVVVGQISTEIQQCKIAQIKEINAEEKIITLDSGLDENMWNSQISLFWSRGVNDEGMFKFARKAEDVPSSEENHTGLSDDTYKIMKHITSPETGYAYSFRIPKEKQGFVTSFEICAKAFGSPGAMKCYLIDDRDKDNFKNPIQAYDEYQASITDHTDSFHFFAESRPLTLGSEYGRRYIKFDFLQEDSSYPLMPQDDDNTVRYIAIIECLDCDKNNYYDVQFLQHRDSNGQLKDLELNNITYNYSRQLDNSRKKALLTDDDINASDMYYQIITRSVIENEIEPEKEGLYTFHASTKDITNRIRVMLRVKKEGSYKANTESEKPKVYTGSSLKIYNSNMDSGIKTISELYLHNNIYRPLELRRNEADISTNVPVIIGNNITELAGRNENSITLATPILATNNDDVYRMAYQVCVKARKVSFKNGVESATEYRHFVVPIKEVFKDYHTYDKEASARIIFEADLFNKDEITEYNDFIVQIYWSNRDMSDYLDIRKAQMGAIKDIVVSFNQNA